MNFEIKLLKDSPRFIEDQQQATWGLIRIGTFEERFLSYTEFWSERDYEHAWIVAIKMLLNGGAKSALVTDAHDPDKGGVSFIWPMYRVEEQVFIQNHMLLPETAPRPFMLEKIIEDIGPRETVDEEGERISEWQVYLQDLAAFRSGL
jgi:hypothetical protein